MTIVVPWLPSSYEELVSSSPLLAILAILAGTLAIVFAAISEFVVRRNSIKKAELTQEPSPYDTAKPEMTISIASVAFLLSLSIYSLKMLLSFFLLMARKTTSLFPKRRGQLATGDVQSELGTTSLQLDDVCEHRSNACLRSRTVDGCH
jgi:hypothetical protein